MLLSPVLIYYSLCKIRGGVAVLLCYGMTDGKLPRLIFHIADKCPLLEEQTEPRRGNIAYARTVREFSFSPLFSLLPQLMLPREVGTIEAVVAQLCNSG